MATVTETFVNSIDQVTATTHAHSGVTIAAGKLAVIRALIDTDTNTDFTSVTDSAGNTWNIAVTKNTGSDGGATSVMIAYSVIANALSAGTVTINLAATHACASDLAYFSSDTGWVAQASVLDKVASAEVTPSATAWSSSATATTTQADELLIGVGSHWNFNGSSSTPGGGWTEEADRDLANVGGSHLTSQWQKVTSTGTYAATGTWTAVENGPCAIATFKTAAGVVVIPPFDYSDFPKFKLAGRGAVSL